MSTTNWGKSAVKRIKESIRSIGPGFITGAADDDPSGIATYSIAGARFGYGLNWLTLLTIPLMIAIQEACARIGITTGKGLAGIIREYYSEKLLYSVVGLLAIANVINIGADLGMMAAVLQMVAGLPIWLWLILVTLGVVVLEIRIPYQKYERILKWLSLILLAYVVTAFVVHPDWLMVFRSLVIPKFVFSLPFIAITVGFLGTSVSPYLFFWQASEEVEEEIANHQIRGFGIGKPKFNGGDIKRMRLDTISGMVFSQMITLTIIITTAETLFRNHITSIDTAGQAALALRPFAGDLAYLLFAAGIIGIGLSAVPVLAGSLAYAVGEAVRAPVGLGKTFSHAKLFYGVIAVSSVVGMLLNVIGLNPLQALYWAAIVNGIIAVPLIFIILKVSGNKQIMGRETNGFVSKVAGWITFLIMGVAALLLVWSTCFGSK